MDATIYKPLILAGQIEIRFRLEPAETDRKLSMFEFTVPAQARVPIPHSHDAYEETIFGLDGALSWTMEGQKLNVGPGDVLFIPRGKVHQFENVGATTARQLSVITPGILGPEYFLELADIIKPGGPPDIQKIMATMQRHGLRPVPPPAPSGVH